MTTISRRIAAAIEDDFVVFIIGARMNRPWRMLRYPWFAATMNKMLAELAQRPESGFLGVERLGLLSIVQYWRSVEHLTAYAREPGALTAA